MRRFYDFIRRGEFRVAVCKGCRRKIWPPSDFCCYCFSATRLTKIRTTGRLIEFTTSHIYGKEDLYGVVDMKGIKLIGSLSTKVTTGMKVRMVECGIRENGCLFYRFDACVKESSGV
jgi:uncharacterized OB-fold protein